MRTGLGFVVLFSGCAADNGQLAPPPGEGRTQVVLVGTFHFAASGDDHRARSPFVVRSPQRQQQIAAVVDQLARWAPTRIGVEWLAERQAGLDRSYASTRTVDGDALPPDEIHQIGVRLADRLDHDRLWAVDARHRWYSELPDGILRKRAVALGQRDVLQRRREWDRWYERAYDRQDELREQHSLVEHLLWLNAPAQLRVDLGRYLVGEIEVGGGGDYTGADVRTAWYNRNLRIYSNILRMRGDGEERIVVLIGAGHVPILQHLVEGSPELELVPLDTVLQATAAVPVAAPTPTESEQRGEQGDG